MQVIILNDNIRVKHLQQPRQSREVGHVQLKTTVSKHLDKRNVSMADPPLVEPHGQPNEFECEVRHDWDDHHVEELLLVVRVCSKQRVRVLREVVLAVEFPEKPDVVHQPVVPVEPEVEHDPIDANLQRQPSPIHQRG